MSIVESLASKVVMARMGKVYKVVVWGREAGARPGSQTGGLEWGGGVGGVFRSTLRLVGLVLV